MDVMGSAKMMYTAVSMSEKQAAAKEKMASAFRRGKREKEENLAPGKELDDEEKNCEEDIDELSGFKPKDVLWKGMCVLASGAAIGTNMFTFAVFGGPLHAVIVSITTGVSTTVAYREVMMDDINTVRKAGNLLRESVNALSVENVRLTGEIDRLEKNVSALKETEARLKDITGQQDLNVKHLVGLVKTNKKVLAERQKVVRQDVVADVTRVVLKADKDESGDFDDKEIKRLIQYIEDLPSVKVNQKRLHRALSKNKSVASVIDIVNDLGRPDIPDKKRIFSFDFEDEKLAEVLEEKKAKEREERKKRKKHKKKTSERSSIKHGDDGSTSPKQKKKSISRSSSVASESAESIKLVDELPKSPKAKKKKSSNSSVTSEHKKHSKRSSRSKSPMRSKSLSAAHHDLAEKKRSKTPPPPRSKSMSVEQGSISHSKKRVSKSKSGTDNLLSESSAAPKSPKQKKKKKKPKSKSDESDSDESATVSKGSTSETSSKKTPRSISRLDSARSVKSDITLGSEHVTKPPSKSGSLSSKSKKKQSSMTRTGSARSLTGESSAKPKSGVKRSQSLTKSKPSSERNLSKSSSARNLSGGDSSSEATPKRAISLSLPGKPARRLIASFTKKKKDGDSDSV